MQGRAPVLQLDLQGSRVLRQAVPEALILCYLPGTMEHILAATSRQKVGRGASCARVTALLYTAIMLRMNIRKGSLYDEVQGTHARTHVRTLTRTHAVVYE